MRFAFQDKGYYELNPFPGCNQLIVSNHVTIKKEYRGNGAGKEMSVERIDKAKELGYDYMLSTVKKDNEVQIHIMRTMGYKYLDQFHNSETGNDILIMGLPLT